MLELCSQRDRSHLTARDRRLIGLPFSETAVFGCDAFTSRLAIARRHAPAAVVCCRSRAPVSASGHKSFGISTYEIAVLKPPLESTLTESNNSGIPGLNQAFCTAPPVNHFRMIFLHEECKQLFCNDTLAEKGGGHPCLK